MEEFPGNSKHAAPKKEVPKKKVTQTVQSEVVRRKKPLGKRFKETFIQDDAQTVLGFVAASILIPAAKDMMEDAVGAAIHRILRGDSARYSRGYRGTSGSSNFNYAGISKGSSAPEPVRIRAQHKFDEIVIEHRVEAEETLNQMFDMLAEYEVVTLSDLYQMLGQSTTWQDDKWGWTDLRGASVERVRGGGWILDLPRPKEIK